VTWDLGSIPAGESRTLNLVVNVASDLEDGTVLRNIAVANSPTDDQGPKESEPEDVTVEEDLRALLTIQKSAMSSTVAAGEELTYQISINNRGSGSAQDVIVTDPIPEGTAFVSANLDGAHTNGVVTWSLGTVEAGESIDLELTVLVDEDLSGGTTIRNIATVESPDDPEGPKENDPEDVVVEDDAQANLTIQKSAMSGTVGAGEELTYQITISNSGTGSAQDVIVTDPIPEGTAFVSANLDGAHTNGVVIWSLGTVEAGESIVLELTVLVDEDLPGGTTIRNIATVESPDDPEGPKENDPEDVLVEEDEILDTQVSVVKTSNVASASPGDLIEFSIQVTNEGENSAMNVVITDILPDGLMAMNANSGGEIEGNTVTWIIDSIQPEESITVIVTAMVTAEEGSIINSVVVTGDNFEDEEDESDPVTLNLVDLVIEKEVSANIVGVGTRFEYRIRITNNSENTATEVEVSDFLPIGVRFIDAVPERGSIDYDGTLRVLHWRIDELAPGETLLLNIDVLAETPGEKSNTARVTSRERDSNENDNTSTVAHTQIEFEIPNVFTPNGDGINDTWEIRGIQEFFSSNSLLIVNRWGVEVYKSDNYANDWNGGSLSAGTYYYQLKVVRLDGSEEVFKGYVTILR
ncbi:gliding motility-associated C-terminal domain-containing protein, partial [Mongoliibacter ruber]